MATPDIFRYAGFAPEVTFGTAVAAAFHVESISNGLDSPDTPEILIDSGCGRGFKTKVPGYYSSAGPVDYHPDIETIGWFWRWFLTGYQYTAAVEPAVINTHEMYGTASSTLKSVTVREGRDNWEQIFAGCMLNTIDLRVDCSAQVGSCSLGWIGGKDTSGSIQTESTLLLPSASLPLGFAEASVSINSVDESALLKSMSISGTNNIDAKSAQRFGSRFPQGGFLPAKRQITFSAQIVFEDTNHKELFWGGATGPVAGGSTEAPIEFVFEDPDAARSLTIDAPRCIIKSVKNPTRGSDPLIEEVVGLALIDTDVALADASTVDTEILVTLLNKTATMA